MRVRIANEETSACLDSLTEERGVSQKVRIFACLFLIGVLLVLSKPLMSCTCNFLCQYVEQIEVHPRTNLLNKTARRAVEECIKTAMKFPLNFLFAK